MREVLELRRRAWLRAEFRCPRPEGRTFWGKENTREQPPRHCWSLHSIRQGEFTIRDRVRAGDGNVVGLLQSARRLVLLHARAAQGHPRPRPRPRGEAW